MPNWCDTEYIVTGPKEQLERLFNIMNNLENMPDPGLIDNDFGSSWLGNLVMALGKDPDTIGRCRGTWYGLELKEDRLIFWTCTAWCEADDTRHLLESCFPNLTFYFMSEELGCDYWATNDINGKFFQDRYYLYTHEDGSFWYSDIAFLLDYVEEFTHTSGLETYQDCVNAIRDMPPGSKNIPYIKEVSIVS